ncbi:MAG: DUF2934 domain-containing protein [Acidobacteria bacterium]|nr:DUF2934 domain-containing protein [Acidobacteriota bacterium]
MPTKRTIKAEAVSQPVVAPLTVKAIKAAKAVDAPKTVKAAKTAEAPNTKKTAAPVPAASKPAPAKAKAPKAATKAVKAEPKEVASRSPLTGVTITSAELAAEPIIATHSVPTEMVSLTALSDEISRVAYQLWMEGGCQHGRALDDWARAEDLVKSRYGL